MASLAAGKPSAFTIDASELKVPAKKPTDTPVKALSKEALQAKLDSADKRREQKLTTKVGLRRPNIRRLLCGLLPRPLPRPAVSNGSDRL